ncbi:MAG: arginine--tRNA ligase [Alphaproteobacteria bacterium]
MANVFSEFRDKVITIVEELSERGALPRGLDASAVTVEPPRDAAHGDLATNAALVLARQAKRKPRDIADAIAARLAEDEAVTEAQVAGPGFINLRLADGFWQARVADVLAAGNDYGASHLGAGQRVNVEYVSVNPTGPLHVGHARGAVYGDALAALLEKVGFEVIREYYINDAGAQVDALARSAYWRGREALGETVSPDVFKNGYPGKDVEESATAVMAINVNFLPDAPSGEKFERWRDLVVKDKMERIRDDLAALGVHQKVFTSERELVEKGRVQEALSLLDGKGLIYTGVLEPPKGMKPEDWEPRPQTLFRSTAFGDDVDRPLRKSDGSWTYFAADIAYHLDKIERGFDTLIDVWGADHGGYVKRMKAAVKALSSGAAELDVKLCQLVKLMRAGQPVKMSKRAGSFVTLREVVDEVGKDVVRFIMLTRKNDAPLDFDLVRVTEQSKDNPVFYVQYAHARVCSLMRMAAEQMPGLDASARALAAADLDRLTNPAELALIKSLAGWPRQIESAAEAHEPHRLAFYLNDVAAAFHGLWNKGNEDPRMRFIVADDEALSRARLALARATALVIASGLGIFGVEPVEEMR